MRLNKIIAAAALVALAGCGESESTAANDRIKLFYLETCPHCHNAMNYFASELPDVPVEKYEVRETGNGVKFQKQLKDCNLSSTGVPVIVVGKKCWQGFDPVSTGAELKQALGK